jgi:hypothetical protein
VDANVAGFCLLAGPGEKLLLALVVTAQIPTEQSASGSM